MKILRNGFSIIELLIAISISMILISMGSFYFRDFSRDEDMRSIINNLVLNIKTVKNEVVFSNNEATLGSNSGTNWNSYRLEINGNLISEISIPNGYSLVASEDGFSFRDDGFVIHDSGAATNNNFLFTVCDNKRVNEKGKRIKLGVLGEITYEETNCS